MEKVSIFIKIRVLFWPKISALGVFFILITSVCAPLNNQVPPGGIVILILLDLSAAFDTIDHDALFSRMESTLGITGPALE